MSPLPDKSWCLLVVALLGVACSQEPDLTRASARELLELTEQRERDSRHDSLSARAARELSSRPRAGISAELLRLGRAQGCEVRGAAASFLGEFMADTDEPLVDAMVRRDSEVALLGLLEDREENVRASALFALGRAWSASRPARVNARVATTLGELLESKVAGLRLQAAFVAMWLGPAVDSQLAKLLSVLKSETDAAVRFAVTSALGALEKGDRHVVGVLLSLMDDPEEKVRFAAAGSLGRLGQAAALAMPRLTACFADGSESPDVRKAAVASLAELVRDPKAAAQALTTLVESQSLFAEHEQRRWLRHLGVLAVAAPRSEAALVARQRLEAALRAEDENLVWVGASSLARIARAEHDVALGRNSSVLLRGAISKIGEALARSDSYAVLESDTYQPVLESLVALSLWSEMEIDPAGFRSILDRAATREVWWIRRWAEEQIAKLK